MGFRTGSYATVWEVRTGKGNYADVRLSISKKNKLTDQYETDFNGFVRFIGDAYQKATNLKERDRIKIGDCDVTNRYDKEKKTTYVNYAVFSFEDANNGNGQSVQKTDASSFVNVPDADMDELPFN